MATKAYNQLKILNTFGIIATALCCGCNAPDASPSAAVSAGPNIGQPHALSQYAMMDQCLSSSASVVGFSDTQIKVTGNGTINGSVVLLGNSSASLSGNGSISGQVVTSNQDQIHESGNASIGNVVIDDLTSNEQAVLQFGDSLDALTETQEFNSGINASTTIQGNGALNVIQVDGDIHLSGKDALIFNGQAADLFLVNVSGNVNLSGQSQIKVAGGVSPANILFRLMGSNAQITVTGSSNAAGTFYAPRGTASISGNGTIEGSVFAWNQINISGNGLTWDPVPFCPGKFAPAPSPSPSASASPSPSGSVSPSPSPSPSGSVSPSPSPSPSDSVSPSPSPSPSDSVSPSPSPSPSGSVSPSPSPSPSSSSCDPTNPFCGGGILGT